MSAVTLTQAEADALIAIEKRRIDGSTWDYPGLGGKISIPLVSFNAREQFILDISRGRINLQKGTYQTRAHQSIPLVRLDFSGPPHRNPDDQEIGTPHIHLYREGYADKWAFDVPTEKFQDLNDAWTTLSDFMIFCNITLPPHINRGLFS